MKEILDTIDKLNTLLKAQAVDSLAKWQVLMKLEELKSLVKLLQ